MEETNGLNDPTRLDRIERVIEVLANTQVDMQQDLKILLRGQVVIGDALEKLTTRVDRLAESHQHLVESHQHLVESHQRLMEAQQHTDQRMDALILTVDEIVRGRKPQ